MDQLLQEAVAAAIERSDKSAAAKERINNAIKNRLFPYLEENEVISAQILSPEYQKFLKETEAFLKAQIEIVQCPDGRIAPIGLADPVYANIMRRPQGLFSTRASSRTDKPVPTDPDLVSELITAVEDRKAAGEVKPSVVSFVGPHIDSHEATHGCGASNAKLTARGHVGVIGMKQGGIKEYFEELGDGFFAFDNVAELVGATGATFDLTHDSYSQGFIIGLRDAYDSFDPAKSLRQNLLALAAEKRIIMTELLDDGFKERIEKSALKHGLKSGRINVSDHHAFAKNMILIGSVAREITLQEEARDHAFLTAHIRTKRSHIIARNLAYLVIRNIVYRILGGIEPRNHKLLKHPETLLRVGPVGALYNIKNIAFIQTTPRGRIMQDDIDIVNVLYSLSQGVLLALGIDLSKEGRIILVTGVYDADRYRSDTIAHAELNYIKGTVKYNASVIRKMYEPSVEAGETVVLGALFDPDTRRLTHIV